MIKFEEKKAEITRAIESKLSNIPGESGFTLVEGFIMQPLNSEVSGNVIIGGPSIPLVAILGNTSGRIYYFALKALLPELTF